MLNVQVTSRVKELGTKKNIPALTPNRCKKNQLYCTCEPRNPEWETSVGDKCGRQVEDKCKLMRSQTSRVGDTCGRQVEDKCKLSPKNPEWETSVGDKSGETRVGDKCGRQVWETSGRQV